MEVEKPIFSPFLVQYIVLEELELSFKLNIYSLLTDKPLQNLKCFHCGIILADALVIIVPMSRFPYNPSYVYINVNVL